MVDYIIRYAAISDYAAIYALKSASVRPYVEKIWGWDENYQRKDFDEDFAAISQFRVVEAEGAFAGFLQLSFNDECLTVVEIHLLPEYRSRGIGTDILRNMQKSADSKKRKIRIGCFKDNHRAKALYQRLNFLQIEETETHYIFEYQGFPI